MICNVIKSIFAEDFIIRNKVNEFLDFGGNQIICILLGLRPLQFFVQFIL